MKRNYVSKSIDAEMNTHEMRQGQLAEAIGITQPSLCNILNRDIRLAPKTLRALTHCWPSSESNGRVLIAHLRDEINRAGHDPENALDIRLPNGKHADKTSAARDLDVLRDHISDADVAALIHDLALLLKRADRASKQYPETPQSKWGDAAEK